ncbi:hypothetical protein FSP39_025502 [Pinctada imbricata]|uniref:Uncharacterized protein n=1 Tax=Pinctada imbricata TaxID=66713 RepID=A0AA88Y1I0_PINIB|nr:hypothetical protein FSP39_025502 [Pinctada imbricata]
MIAFIFMEIGIAIAYHLLEDQVPALLISTWPQLNNDTKFTLQRQLGCCGIQNYTEWSVELDQIPYSCFKVYDTLSVSTKAWTLLYKTSCLDQLEEWFKDNLPIWASLMTFVALVQVKIIIFI